MEGAAGSNNECRIFKQRESLRSKLLRTEWGEGRDSTLADLEC